MSDDLTPSRVRDLAGAGSSREDAESFALAFAQLQFDVTIERDAGDILGDLTSADMDPAMRKFLENDYSSQRQIGTERHYDPGEPVWIRSAAVGGDSRPTKVMVEVAATVVSVPMDHRSPFRSRVDVVREGDRWKVLDYAAGSSPGRSDGASEGPGTKPQGDGWRPV